MEKLAVMEKRLKEAGISTEQVGQHELVREIHRIQVWIYSLNGGWSANTPPENWKNPIPILENRCIELQAQYEKVQAEIQRVQSTRTQSSPVQSTRTQSVPIQSSPSQLDPFQSNGNQSNSNPMDSNPIGSMPMSSNSIGLDQISFNHDGFNAGSSNPKQSNTTDSSQMPSDGLSAARLNPDHSNRMPSSGLSASRLNPGSASTSPFDQLDPLRTQPSSGSSPQNKEDLSSVVKQVENLNRYVTALEGKLVARIEVCEGDVAMASNQAVGLATQYNEVTRNLSAAIQQVHKLRAEWNEWNGEEVKPQDHESLEEIFHDPAEQSTLLVPSVDQEVNQSNLQERSLRSLIDLSPIQPHREIPTLLPTLGGGIEESQRSRSDGFPKTVLTMAALKGTRRLYVQDQTGFRIGRIVIIHDLFAAQIVAYGSIVIDRPVDRDYPIGSTVRELTPEDDHRVDSQGRTFINGVAMDPGDFGSNTLSLENRPESGRQIPPLPEDGMLVNLDNESKLHAWLLQGMTKTGRTHWNECAEYYRQFRPTIEEVYPQEHGIKYDQYLKAINQIGVVPDMQGRLLDVVGQIRNFEQNLLRVMKGLSRACEFYAKLLLNGVYEFLDRLRTLLTATEQSAQTFAEKQAEEHFHPQLEAHLMNWITMKLPGPVKTRAQNRRSQPSVRILLTEFYFTLLPQPGEQARHLGNLVKNPTSACTNTVEVITNIENWRVSVQLYKETTGQMPIQEDIKTAFEKLITPVVKNVTGFEWKRTFCEQTAYLSITTTDDQVYTYITSVMEIMHRLSKQLKWDSSKPKVQAITSGEESTTTSQKKDKPKGKGKGKGKPKGPPLPDKGKGKGGKGKGKNKSKGKGNNAGGKNGNKGIPAVPIASAPASSSTTVIDGQKKRPKQCVHYASSTGCLRGKNCLYLHQNDPVTKKPMPADPADVQRLSGKPQIVPKAPAGPPPSVQSSTVPISTPSATPKPVVSMIRVDRRELEPEAEPGARHRVATWRMTDGATVSNHPIGRVPEPKGGITATPHFGGLHGGRTHFGSNQSSMWCRCQMCGISTPTVTYQDVCCTACYRLPPRGQRTWTIMKNCVWVKWARLTIQFIWLGTEQDNNVKVAEARRVINYRDARNTFFDAAETVDQMIEFGYIRYPRQERNRPRYLPPNVTQDELDERIAADTRARHLREVFFANRHPRRDVIMQLQDRVRRYVWSCNTDLPYDARALCEEVRRRETERAQQMGILLPSTTTDQQSTTPQLRGRRMSDDDLQEEARQRELESWRELQAELSFQAVDEQGSPTRVVRGMRYSSTGTPRRRTRIEVSGEYVPRGRSPATLDRRSQPETPVGSVQRGRSPFASAINVGALRAPTSGDDRYCMLDSGANVMVIPRMEGMVGDETMCSLVGDNRATGLIVSRLYIGTKSYLVVAVQNAAVLLPPAYLVRIAGYRLSWANQSGGEIFHLKDGYGEPVTVHEDDDLLYLNKNTFWRVAKDMFNAAQNRTGMDWSSIWQALTGERFEDVEINAIKSIEPTIQVDFVELFNPGNFKAHKGTLVAGQTYDVKVNPALDLTRTTVQEQTRVSIAKEDPMILIGAPPCTVFSPMQNINQKHQQGPTWEQKYQEGCDMLQFASQCYWDQIERGMFFLHEHPATASSWNMECIAEIAAHPGVYTVVCDMCRWGMKVRDEIPDDPTQPYLIKKPTKWMTNCRQLADLLSLRCEGNHSHVRLEGGNLTKKAASYPLPLVRDILKVVSKVKQTFGTANYPKDPMHMTIPDSLLESEHAIQVVYNQSTMTAHDSNPPRGVDWDSVVLRRTVNRKTGVVMSEDYIASLDEEDLTRPFRGHVPKEVLTIFFYWDNYRSQVSLNYVEASIDQDSYLAVTQDLLNIYLNDPMLIPRSTYRKAIGEGVRTITYGAHTSLAAYKKSHRFITNITTAERHEMALLLCHKLATLMPRSVPYLAITVVALSTGEELAPHRDIQNHRHFRNATISFGKWTGGVLQVYEDDIWTNQDSCDKWVILDARNTFHRVTTVEGERLSVIFHTPQHLNRLLPDDWEELRRAGFPVDEIWQGGLINETDDNDEEIEECPQDQIMTVRQTSPVISEPEFIDEEKIDIDSHEIIKPTLQSVVWLAELVATTSMKNERIPRKGPKLDQTNTKRILDDIIARAQAPFEEEKLELNSVLVALARIVILIMTLVIKLGAHYHFGILIHQFLARNLWVPNHPDETDGEAASMILTIPTKTVWNWIPNMFGLKRLYQKSSH